MSDAIESKANNNGHDETALIGRESDVVPGRFGEPLQITHVQYSRGGGNTAPKRPLFLCLHGWGSNETDLADMMRYVAPYNDFASLRAPLTLQPAGRFAPGAYSWLHDCVDTGEDLDRDAFAAAKAIDDWVSANIPDDRAVVPIGFSQGGLLAVFLVLDCLFRLLVYHELEPIIDGKRSCALADAQVLFLRLVEREEHGQSEFHELGVEQ